MDRHLSRLGRSVELRLPLSRRRTFVPLLFLVGPDFNKEVLTNIESLSPTGIWPGPAPRGTAQRELGRNYMKKHGVEHDHYAKAVMPHVGRARVDHRFDLVRARAIDQIENWPIGKTVDAYALARALIQHAAFAALFGERDEERIGVLGGLLHDRNVLNWSRGARALRLDLKRPPYGRMLRNAEDLQAFVQEWIKESRGCPHEQDLRAQLANMPASTATRRR